MLRIHHYFHITRVEFFHAALQRDPTPVDEHEIGKDILDLLDLVRRYDDCAAVIEVIVQQRIVELFEIKDVQSKRRIVQHQQFRVNAHNQPEMQLSHHSFRYFTYPAVSFG